MPSGYINSRFRILESRDANGPFPIISIRPTRDDSPAASWNRDIVLAGSRVSLSAGEFADRCSHPFGELYYPGRFSCQCGCTSNSAHMRMVNRLSDPEVLISKSKKSADAKGVMSDLLEAFNNGYISCPILFAALYFHFRRTNDIPEIIA